MSPAIIRAMKQYLSPRESLSLKTSIRKLLASQSGLSESQISLRLEASKTHVHQILMGSLEVFRPVGNPPKWRLHTPTSRKTENSKALKVRAQETKRKSREVDLSGKKKLAGTARTEIWDLASEQSKLPTLASLKLYPWQKEALQSWLDHECSGIVNAVTGTGKTRLALAAIRYQLGKRGRVVVVVPTLSLLQQWYEEITRVFPGRSVARLGGSYKQTLKDASILIALADSGRRYSFDIPKGASCLLVADECHRYAAEANRRVLEDGFNRRLGLTATHERMDGLHLTVLTPFFGSVIYEMGFAKATVAGIIAPLRIATVGCDLKPKEAAEYAEISDNLSRKRKVLIARFGLPKNDPVQFFIRVNQLANGSGEGALLAKSWVSDWSARRTMLSEAPQKVQVLRRIIPAILDADRVLIFTLTIESAKVVAQALIEEGISAAAHTSKVNTQDRETMFRAFADGRLKVLVSAMTLEEGVDVPEADLAIIMGTTQQGRQMIQRVGRVIRRKPDKRYARLLYIYMRDTTEDSVAGSGEVLPQDMLDVANEVGDFRIPGEFSALRTFLKPKRRSRSVQ